MTAKKKMNKKKDPRVKAFCKGTRLTKKQVDETCKRAGYKPPKFVVRVYDGFDNQWCDCCKPVSKEEAERIWKEKTGNGTHNTKFGDIDYYKIFPADTKMVFSDGFGARD